MRATTHLFERLDLGTPRIVGGACFARHPRSGAWLRVDPVALTSVPASPVEAGAADYWELHDALKDACQEAAQRGILRSEAGQREYDQARGKYGELVFQGAAAAVAEEFGPDVVAGAWSILGKIGPISESAQTEEQATNHPPDSGRPRRHRVPLRHVRWRLRQEGMIPAAEGEERKDQLREMPERELRRLAREYTRGTLIDLTEAPRLALERSLYDYEQEARLEEGTNFDWVEKQEIKKAQIVALGKHGRFHLYSVMPVDPKKAPGKTLSLAEYKSGEYQPDPVIDDFDFAGYAKKVDAALEKAGVPYYEVAVVAASHGDGADASGWMYPALKPSPVFINRKPSPTAMAKYSAWGGFRSPHTLSHEYAHLTWFMTFTPSERGVVEAFWQKFIKGNYKAKPLNAPTDYSLTSASEWWAEVAGYAIYPDRISDQVRKFIGDVGDKKATLANLSDYNPFAAPGKAIDPAPTVKAVPPKGEVTPPPEADPDGPVAAFLKGVAGKIKKAVGDYALDVRNGKEVRVIPSSAPHDESKLGALLVALGFTQHPKGFKARVSTGSKGGLVIFAECVTEEEVGQALEEVVDQDSWEDADRTVLEGAQ